ncbi:MAG: hypothetical protein OEY79_04125 [Anaplasmataceae bacterium]|nr:hypothetical protein [Anaplasmataceae bacterium]
MFRSFAEKLTLFLGFTAGIAPSPVNAMPTYGLPSNIPDDIDPFQNPFASLDARQDKAKSKRKGKRKSGAQRRREKRDAAATTHNVDGNISGYKITADGITVDVASDFARLNAGSLGRFEQPAINGKAIATRISGKSVIDIPLSSTLANSRGKYYLQFVLRVDLTTNTHTLIYAGPTKAGATAYLTGTLGDGGNKDRSTIIYPTTIDGKDVLLPVGYDEKEMAMIMNVLMFKRKKNQISLRMMLLRILH